jgi:hypothetical protein
MTAIETKIALYPLRPRRDLWRVQKSSFQMITVLHSDKTTSTRTKDNNSLFEATVDYLIRL